MLPRFTLVKFSLFVLTLVTLLLPATLRAQTITAGGAINFARGDSVASSTVTVSGAPGPVATVQVELLGVTTNGQACCYSMQEAEFMLQSPSGEQFVLLGATGDGVDGCDNTGNSCAGLHAQNIIISNSGTAAPNGNPWPAGTQSVEPSSYFQYGFGTYPPLPSATDLADYPQSDGSATMNGKFAGVTANGTWKLFITDIDTPSDPVSVTGWTLSLTYSAATATTTTLSANAANPAFYANNASSISIQYTATVSPSGATGTVTFTANGSTISGCSGLALSGGVAHCTTSLSQGNNGIVAQYTPTGNYGQSSGSITQLVEVTPANPSGDQWCNNNLLSVPTADNPGLAYPGIIDINNAAYNGKTVSNVTVELESVVGVNGLNGQFLLVAPGGTKDLVFLDDGFAITGATGSLNLTFADNGTQYVPYNSGTPSSGTYLATDDTEGVNLSTFATSVSPTIDSGVPQVPSTLNFAPPYGSDTTAYTHTNILTFGEAFNGASANGKWALYTVGPYAVNLNSGWCITLSLNTGNATTTTLTPSSNPATTGHSVTFTATVTSGGNPVTSGGTVTFQDNGATPAGTVSGNNVVVLNGSGQATFTTSALTEGDHPILATYSGTSSDNESFSPVLYQRINTATTAASVNSNTWQYCNPGAVQIQGQTLAGPLTPNPSNIFVTNLPGTLNTATVTLKNFSVLTTDDLEQLASLVEGPDGTALDFFSNTTQGSSGNGEASLGNYIFADSAAGMVSAGNTSISPGTYKPTAYLSYTSNPDTFTSSLSGFYNVPAFSYAPSHGSSTFADVFTNGSNANGNWSLFFSSGYPGATFGAANGWCVNLTENLPSVTADAAHNGTFTQGEQGAQITADVTDNGPGSTGDPTGSNPMTVVDTLNAAFTYSSFSGTGWSCSAAGRTVTCTNDSPIGNGVGYPTLTIDVNVGNSATGTVTNSFTASGAGASSASSNTDSIAIDVPPAITSGSSATFTVGTAGSFTVTSTGTPTSSLSESGSLPIGVTFTDNGNGTATLSGIPASGSGGSYPITITASNGVSPNGNQNFTLTVNQPPAITSGSSATFTAGAAGSFTVTASGYPASTISESGLLPGGITFSGGVLSGAPTVAGSYPISFTATNGVSPDATQNFTLTVVSGPAVNIAVNAPASSYLGSPISFTVTAYDLYGNVATSYGGTVAFTSSDPAASLPGSSAISNGTGTFTATFNTLGTQTITATDAANSLSATSSGTTVTVPNLVVTTATDDEGTAGNCTPQATPGQGTDGSCSLRDALLQSAALGSSNISFNTSTFTGAQFITLTNGTLNIPSNTSISGPTQGAGAALTNIVTVNGNAASTVFTVGSGVTNSSFSGLIVTNGSSASGGGISNAGALSVTASTIIGNAAISGGQATGGGIFNTGTLTLSSSTVSGNSATGGTQAGGGGIYNSGSLSLTLSTVSGNSASAAGNGGGGGILSNGGTLALNSSTISANTADGAGGGLYINAGAVTLANTIDTGNSASGQNDVSGAYTDNGGNVIVGAAVLSALDSYGGPTRTMVPQPGGAAICAGTLANANAEVISFDQRGYGFDPNCPAGSVDSGAVQTNYALTFTTAPPSSVTVGTTFAPPPVVQLTENLQSATWLGNTVTMTDSASMLGGTTSVSLSGSWATFSNLNLTRVATNDSLTATMALTGSINLTVNSPSLVSSIGQVQTITFPPLPSSLPANATVTLAASTSASLPVLYSTPTPSVCTISGTTVTLLAEGTCVIQARQNGNGIFGVASMVQQLILVQLVPQTINFPAIVLPQYALTHVTLTAAATSGLGITYTSVTPSICTVTRSSASLLAPGQCIMHASQSGNLTYTTAPTVSVSFPVQQAQQTISFPAPAGQQLALTQTTLTATASSALAVSYSSTTPAVCTVSGSAASLLAPGYCIVQASQTGNSLYSAAPPVTTSFAVNLAAQTITFTPVANQFAGASVTLSASASSSLAVAFTSLTPSMCTVSGTMASMLSAGECVIHVSQAGNSFYSAAATVSQDIFITPQSQTIGFPAITATLSAASTLPLSATATSGLTVSFNSSTPAVCTVSGTTASLLSAGTCIVQATQAGSGAYAAAPPVQQNLAVHLAQQSISFPPVGNQLVNANVTLSATATSGLTVTFASATPSICTVSGSTATMNAAGACVIHATQAGNSTYAPAQLASQLIVVTTH